MDDEQRQVLKDYFPPPPQPEILIPKVDRELNFTLLDFREEKEIQPPTCDSYTRFLFNIVDHADGKTKILSLGKKTAHDLSLWILEPKEKPQRHWFMRCLEWLRVVKPLPNVYHQKFQIRGDFDGPFPRYRVYALD